MLVVAPALPLTRATLPALAGRVRTPGYDRTALVPAIVHLGVGGFHRAHQAVYLDDLAELGETGWGVVGVSLRTPAMGHALRAQDGLFTVVERGPVGERARVVGSVVGHHYAPDDPAAVVRALADPRTRLVTLTVTAAGYCVDEHGRLDRDHPGVQADLAEPARPSTAIGFLVEALRLRRETGVGPFTVLSCDNLPDSGVAARTAVVSFARLRDPRLAAWIGEHVTFPSSMVDRITPETSDADREAVASTYGVLDRWPVVAEPFRQWVVEDDFCAGRPPLDRVGVQFVEDVRPHKLVKTRLLNGGHCVLGHVGLLAGHTRSDEAMADPVVRALVERLLEDEVAPLLPAVPGIDLQEYVTDTLERFANPAVADPLARLARRSSDKVPAYLLPSLVEARASGRPHDLLVVAVAAWLRHLRGTDLAGHPLLVEDPRVETLQALAQVGQDDPRPLLGARSVFGSTVDDLPLVALLADALRELSASGLHATVAQALSRELTAA